MNTSNTEHDLAEAAIDLLLDTAVEFEGDEDGDLTSEERETLWRIVDEIDSHGEGEGPDDEDEEEDDDVFTREPIQNAAPPSDGRQVDEQPDDEESEQPPSEDDRLQHPDQPISSETAPYRSEPTPPLSEDQAGHQFGGTANVQCRPT